MMPSTSDPSLKDVSQNIDLWNIYRLVKQRHQRAKSVCQKQAAYEALAAMKETRDNPTISNAVLFQLSESNYLNNPYTKSNSKPYGTLVVSSISTNSYVLNKPIYNIYHLGNCDPEIGIIYIASSQSHPSQIKIGYTTLSIKKRFKTYSNKYGYALDLEYFAEVTYPARVEHEVFKILKHLRISGRTNGDSNEWFWCNKKLAINTIHSICTSNDFMIYSENK